MSARSSVESDPLADVLAVLSVKSTVSASLRARGAWSVRFGPVALKMNALLEGSAVLVVEDGPPIALAAGDCWFLRACSSYVLASEVRVRSRPAGEVFRAGSHATIGNAGAEAFLVGGAVELDAPDAQLLLDELPSVLHVPASAPGAASMRWLLGRLGEEWQHPRPASTLVVDHLAQLVFVEMIRAWLATDQDRTGWIRALGDRRIGAALRLVHGDPAHGWQLPELAAAAGMSRSSFALRFKELVGIAPLDYVLRWRMRLAAKALRTGARSVTEIASSTGYRSESAFCNAFKRVVGEAPQRYRRRQRLGG